MVVPPPVVGGSDAKFELVSNCLFSKFHFSLKSFAMWVCQLRLARAPNEPPPPSPGP